MRLKASSVAQLKATGAHHLRPATIDEMKAAQKALQACPEGKPQRWFPAFSSNLTESEISGSANGRSLPMATFK